MTGGQERLRELVLPAAAVGGAAVVVVLLLVRVIGGSAHAGDFALRCLTAPLALLDAAAHLGTVAGFGAVVLAALAMVAAVARQAVRGRDVARSVARARLAAMPPSAAAAATAAGIAARVDVVEARRPFAFVYGWLRPRVCVSTGLVEHLSTGELQAALLHERWHVMQRDPVRLTVAAAIRAGFRFVPAFPRRVERYAVAVEVAADRFVVAEMGHPKALAGALLRLEPGDCAPGFAGQTEARVAALVGTDTPPQRSRAWAALTALAAEVVLAVALANDPRFVAPVGIVLLCAC